MNGAIYGTYGSVDDGSLRGGPSGVALVEAPL